ncbi:MAG TPA: oxygenase MpaB family protein [Candidatus Dormibacteraeota bacterium]|nr:oxygenase MpaB family protein [Candidatus Dormibacteraeota bacterium]
MSVEAPETQRGAPIGPGSLLWENLGRRYNLLTAASAGILQNMLPGLGAGVEGFSEVRVDPGQRVAVSAERILEPVYGPNPEEAGREIRDIHKHIKGHDEQGRSYHALNPKTFWWAHATFEVAVVEGRGRFSGHPFAREERRQVNRESMTWFSLYGMTSRPVPKDLEAFEKEYERICEEELELTPAADYLIGLFQEGDIESFVKAFNIDPRAWKFGRKAVAGSARLFAIGGLPKPVRERFDIPFSRSDELKLKTLDANVRAIAPRLSEEQFYLPIALEGIRRERANHGQEAAAA